MLDALKNGKLQLAMGDKPGKMPGAGQGKNQSKMPGLGGGKGGRGAGFASAPKEEEKKDLKVAKLPPNAKVPGQRSDMKNPGLTLQYKGGPDQNARSGAPYYQVYAQQKRAAESAVDKENIPAAYKKQVKDYFNSIKP